MKQSRLNFCFKRPDCQNLKLIIGNGNTRRASASASMLIERRGGLPCSAEVEEEASAVFGRRRGTRSRTRQPGPVLTRPPLDGVE